MPERGCGECLGETVYWLNEVVSCLKEAEVRHEEPLVCELGEPARSRMATTSTILVSYIATTQASAVM